MAKRSGDTEEDGTEVKPQIARFPIRRVEGIAEWRDFDNVAVEAPLAIHLTYSSKSRRLTEPFAIAMRTPGADRELVAGYLVGEGLVRRAKDIQNMHAIGVDAADELVAELAEDVDVELWRLRRNSFASSACGICGKQFAAAVPSVPVTHTDATFRHQLIADLPGLLRNRQTGFERTGALHAAATFDANGVLTAVFEDVGRHNALDKVTGAALFAGLLPLHNQMVVMSSRASYELVQKAAVAGAPALVTVGGPSSLAIEAARSAGMTLICFLREQRFNVYSGDWRIKS